MPAKKQRKNRSALKALRQSATRHLHNMSVKSRIKTAVTKARTAIGAGDPAIATALTREACQLLDKAVSHGVLHDRAASRRKSRLAHSFSQAFSPAAPTEEAS